MREIDTKNKQQRVIHELIDVRVKNITNIYGNTVNEIEIEDYNQFREFFVQQVKPNSKAPLDGLFMDKRKPIFQDQPIVKPDNFDDYWMNTPLQSIKN